MLHLREQKKNYLLFIFKLLLLVANLLLYGGEFCQKLLLTSKALKMRYSPIFMKQKVKVNPKPSWKRKWCHAHMPGRSWRPSCRRAWLCPCPPVHVSSRVQHDYTMEQNGLITFVSLVFSCPGQLNKWHCRSVCRSEPTNNQSQGSIKEWP